jgi:hypothetical protein
VYLHTGSNPAPESIFAVKGSFRLPFTAKMFKCKSCGMTKDADLNAAVNHELDLVVCPFDFRSQENRKGFFWNLEREPTVPF